MKTIEIKWHGKEIGSGETVVSRLMCLLGICAPIYFQIPKIYLLVGKCSIGVICTVCARGRRSIMDDAAILRDAELSCSWAAHNAASARGSVHQSFASTPKPRPLYEMITKKLHNWGNRELNHRNNSRRLYKMIPNSFTKLFLNTTTLGSTLLELNLHLWLSLIMLNDCYLSIGFTDISNISKAYTTDNYGTLSELT